MNENPTERPIIASTIALGDGERVFHLFDTPLGRLVCQEVLSGKSYPLVSFADPVRTVVDVGANVGAATVYFALHYPHARVEAFEPSPASARLLERNTTDLANVTVHRIGLADEDGEALIYHGRQDSVTDSLHRSVLNSEHATTIEVRDAGRTLRELGLEDVDVLKLDTEGSEVAILESLGDARRRIRVLYVEFHAHDARLRIDALLSTTHLLCRAAIESPHRGELCYVARAIVPPDAEFTRLEIA